MRMKLLLASTMFRRSGGRILQPASKYKAYFLASALILGLSANVPSAHAQLTTLYEFQGSPDGESPYGGLVEDSTGAFYGTTEAGGKNSCGSTGCGTVYKLAGTKESWVYSFKGYPKDGQTPGYINLVTDGKGNFYGTTAYGGNGPCKLNGISVGCGTIFEITSAGVETPLYSFQWGPKDGAGPNSTLILDSATGVLYGTTEGGGNLVENCMEGAGCGTVFQFTISTKKEKVLYEFCTNKTTCPDGAGPAGMLAQDSAGNIYGTTEGGGAHLGGTAFKLILSTGVESVLYSFCAKTNCADGEGPAGGLTLKASTGILYGTTISGGTGVCGQETTGGGTLFQITTAGKNFRVLHDFPSSGGDGCNPWGTVTMDTAGNLYGTTFLGGDGNPPLGTVYEYSASGKESVLYSFDGVGDIGAAPLDTLIHEKRKLYGTTVGGGGATVCSLLINGENLGGCGTVFELTP